MLAIIQFRIFLSDETTMIMAAVCTSDTLTYFSEHLVDKLAALP
jgi:hypothetical protein